VVLFIPYAMTDFMFPPSTFLSLVLETYCMQLTHLTPNSIFALSVFVYWCEQMPILDAVQALLHAVVNRWGHSGRRVLLPGPHRAVCLIHPDAGQRQMGQLEVGLGPCYEAGLTIRHVGAASLPSMPWFELATSPKIWAVPGRLELGRARAFLNGPRPGMNKSRAVLCPPDGLVARPRHDTSPVNRAVLARRARPCWPTCPTRKRFKTPQNFIFSKFHNL
jgi:hypothetical protein